MSTFKSGVFSAFNKASKALRGSGISKILPADAMYEYFYKLLWADKNEIEIQGSKMYVDVFHPDPSMRRTFRYYSNNRIHEETTTDLFKQTLKPGNIFLDLGANIGYFTILASKLVGKTGKVFSFEPEPRNFKFLNKNIEINNYTQSQAFHKAIADENGTARLYICHYDTGHHTLNQYEGIQAYRPEFKEEKKEFVDVDKVKLDDFLKDKVDKVDVIKMDVEGCEVMAFKGMKELIKKSDNLVMFVEYFPLLIKKMGFEPEEMAMQIFEEFKFNVFVIEDDYSMQAEHKGGAYFQIHSANELNNLIKHENDHLNLLLKKKI